MGQSPQTIVDIVDFSKLPLKTLKGVACVQGVTMKGELATPTLIEKWDDFLQIYGGFHPQSMFPYYCKRALDNGAKLYVSRAANYDDVNFKDTFDGVAAKAFLDGPTNTVRAVSLYPGLGYNNVQVIISGALSPVCDITVRQSGMEDQKLTGVKRIVTRAELAAINKQFIDKYRKKALINIVGTFAIGDTATITLANTSGYITLSGGAQDLPILADNYKGASDGGTGWYAFNEIVDSKVIYNFDAPMPEVDAGLAEYCAKRKDMRFVIRTPLELTANGMEDYRMGTGAYSHQPLDTYFGKLIAGDIRVFYNGAKVLISAIADVCALEMKKSLEWLVAAGLERGVLPNDVVGCPYNLLSPALRDDYNNIYEKGINAVGIHRTGKTVYWGNRTLLLDQTKLLKFDNVADLAMYIRETLLGIIEKFNFEPNDLKMYEQVYIAVKPFIESLEAGRAIHPGKWEWQGDQFASSVEDLQFNTLDDLQQGRFSADFLFAPIVANEIISIRAGVSDLGSFAEIV